MRGPKPTKPKPEPEAIAEEAVTESTESVEVTEEA
jgi:hypothetical protein